MKKRVLSMIMAFVIAMGIIILPDNGLNLKVNASEIINSTTTTTLKLNKSKITLGVGETFTIKSKTNSINTITYTSSDKEVATVNNDVIIAKAVGKTIITATVDSVTAKITVTVKKAPESIKANLVALSDDYYAITLLPKNTASNQITYKVSDPSVVKVDKNGKIIPLVNSGKCKITVTTFNGKSASFNIIIDTVKDGSVIMDGENIFRGLSLGWDNGYTYLTDKNKKGIYRLKNGEKTANLITNDSVEMIYTMSIKIYGNWIYYKNITDGGLYKIKTNATGKKKLSDDENIDLLSITLDSDLIYYRSGTTYYKMKNDGTTLTLITGYFSVIDVENGWVYYNQNDDGIFKIKNDGTGKTLIIKGDFSTYGIKNGYIYYSHMNQTNWVSSYWKIKTDGTGQKEFNSYEEFYNELNKTS